MEDFKLSSHVTTLNAKGVTVWVPLALPHQAGSDSNNNNNAIKNKTLTTIQ